MVVGLAGGPAAGPVRDLCTLRRSVGGQEVLHYLKTWQR